MKPHLDLAPALCRIRLLPEALRTRVNDLLTAGGTLFNGISINLDQRGEDLFVMGRPRLLTPNGAPLSAFEAKVPETLAHRAQSVLLELIDTEGLSTSIENIDIDGLMIPNQGPCRISIFRGCAIFSDNDPIMTAQEMFANDRLSKTAMRLRAPACTLILDTVDSHHEALAQPGLVRAALETWQRANGMSAKSAPAPGVWIVPPTDGDILACDASEVEE